MSRADIPPMVTAAACVVFLLVMHFQGLLP